MNFRWLLLFLISFNVQANRFPVEIIEHIDDMKVVAFINETDIEKSMQWSPFSDLPPPVSINQVVAAVKKKITSDAKLSEATITEIELKSMPHHKKHWHYLVKLRANINGKADNVVFIVLMDGKVIRAMKEPEAIK